MSSTCSGHDSQAPGSGACASIAGVGAPRGWGMASRFADGCFGLDDGSGRGFGDVWGQGASATEGLEHSEQRQDRARSHGP
jgi:hypothetical protein